MSPDASKRRPKPQLSCHRCRAKKLKCDHTYPCTNCSSRPPGTCVYVTESALPSSARDAPQRGSAARSKRSTLTERLDRMERLAATLSASIKAPNTGAQSAADMTAEDVQTVPPRLQSEGEETWIIDSSHWEALSNEIADIRHELHSSRATSLDGSQMGHDPGSHLLFTCSQDVSLSELVCSLPPRASVEKLLAVLPNDVDNLSHLSVIHFPTLQKECRDFWREPKSVSLVWLAQLYALLGLSVQCSIRQGSPLPIDFPPHDALYTYTLRAAQCLAKSGYMRPAKGIVPAMIFYLGCEHLRNGESVRFEPYLIFGFLIRMALIGGYHRDPRHYSMSPLDTEMRRRTWAFISSMDNIISAKWGLPCGIDERQADTLPPSNLLDEDLSEEMTVSPSPRPDSEPTNVAYLSYMTRILSLSSQINSRVNSPAKVTYEEILTLDKELEGHVAARPAWLAWESTAIRPAANKTIPNYQLEQQIAVDLVIQHARMVLHREYLIPARTLPKFAHSREVCLEAATRVLQHHRELASHDARFISVTQHHFLLAAILMALDIEHDHRACATLGENDAEGQSKGELEEQAIDKTRLLEQSYRAWSSIRLASGNADQVARVMEILLAKLTGNISTQVLQSSLDRTTPSQEVMSANVQHYSATDGQTQQAPFNASSTGLPFSYTSPEDIVSTAELPGTFGQNVYFPYGNVSATFSDIHTMLGTTDMDVDWAAFDARYLFPS